MEIFIFIPIPDYISICILVQYLNQNKISFQYFQYNLFVFNGSLQGGGGRTLYKNDEFLSKRPPIIRPFPPFSHNVSAPSLKKGYIHLLKLHFFEKLYNTNPF